MKQKFLNSFYALFLFTGIVQAQEVTSDKDDDSAGTLRQVIANAAEGATITFKDDVKHITLVKGQIEIDKSLTITGNGVLKTEIDAAGKGRIFGIATNSGSVTLSNMLLTNGSAFDGGAIYAQFTNLTTTNLVVSNSVSTLGGGIYVYGETLTMTNCNISNNTASKGGGLYIESSSLDRDGGLTITNSTIANNTAATQSGSGGGLYFKSDFSADISTSTFSGNKAIDGGAIYNVKSLNFTIDASTLANNSATGTGGGICNTDSMTLKNTIVAQNNAVVGRDVYTTIYSFLSSGYNLIGQDDNADFTVTPSDLVGTKTAPIDPKIELLTNDDGSTRIYKLLKGSPAFNTGNPADMFPDQIGQAVFGEPIKRRDIGAYEAQEDLLGNPVFDVKNSSSTVWPNPSNGTIKINLSTRLGNTAKGSLIEMASGKTVRTFAVNGNSEINLQNYAAGLYIVKLESESVTENQKLIIQ